MFVCWFVCLILTGATYNVCSPIFEVRRDLALENLTSFELTMLLNERGWQWKLFPVAVANRISLCHDATAGVGVYYTLGKRLIREYLLCLLECTVLHNTHAIDIIPHYRRKTADHQMLLQGQKLEPEVVGETKTRRRPLPLDDIDAEVMAIEDDPKRPRLEDDVMDERSEDDGQQRGEEFVDDEFEAAIRLLIEE